ncbi:MAG: ABC transporter permease [Rubrobacteraceae bacterium]
MSYSTKVRATRWAVILAAVAALEILPRAGLGDAITLIPLSEILPELFTMLASGEMTPHLLATGGAFVLSFVLAGVTGVPLGYLLWRYRPLKRTLDPYLTTYYAIPIFAFYPLLLAVLGFNIWPIVAISWAWAVVAVVLNTAIGFGEVPRVLVKVGQSMNLSRWQILSRIFFPASIPYVFTGLKLGMVYSLIGVIASEFVLSTKGLGYLVSYNYTNFRTATMYSAMFLILALAILLNWALNSTERRLHGHG